ncbi:single-stranded-DNA-specific exonuclease RecJ [candidate division WOR-3 bacterium]|nr:single-stranded-DNA-specific exonuclease RecJ [candidate division WOR-3 bacterium]
MTQWVARDIDRSLTDLVIRGKTVPKEVVQILAMRGYDTPERIERYFAPRLSDLYDPFLMPNMEQAVDRMLQALSNNEKVLVHGDYDTDGITGTALLVRNFQKLGIQTVFYIPNRLEEGYGLSMTGIEFAHEQECSLIFTVDCGITAIETIAAAAQHGIDVIVCDHHKPLPVLPDAYALLDPKLSGSEYPFQDLAGVGVAYKFLQALYSSLDMPLDELQEDLDLVALGTVVDVVSLIDENRILVMYGIKRIQSSEKKGLQALLKEASLSRGLAAYHLGFIIGPRINACGRMRSAQDALELLLTEDQALAQKHAKRLSKDNIERQTIEDTIFQDAYSTIVQRGFEKDRIIVAAQENWHEGIVGIVASRISEAFYKPVILLTLNEQRAKGSGRSISGFDITAALTEHSTMITRFGGHAQAAGLELPRENVDGLRQALNASANTLEESLFKRTAHFDLELQLTQITKELVFFLKYFEPTGMANPQAVFLGKNLEIVGVPRVVGSNHLKFALREEGTAFEAFAYRQADSILKIEPGKTRIDCLYSISEDSFFGKNKIMLKVKNMSIADDQK